MLSKLGKYEIAGELGRGAMGVVYRAEDPRLGRPVALKTTTAEVAGNPELLKRFYREAQAAAKLAHPNIVTIYEIDEANGVPFIAMEFLEGENLQKIIAERRELPMARRLQIIIETCRALHYAHQHGVVHRDVKPGNIVVLNTGQIKIVDFGIARVGVSSMTNTGEVMGTVMYMSPEQVQGQKVDARSDVFSLGVVLYEVLTSHVPFPGDDVPSIFFKILNEPPEPLTTYIPQCPPQLEQVLRSALEKSRDRRYQTTEDLAFDLQRIADGLKRETVDGYLQQGQVSLEKGEFTVAKECLQRVLEVDSSHEVAKALLAEVRERIQARQRAEKVEESLRQARVAMQAQHYEDVIALLDETLILDPAHPEAKNFRQFAVEQRDRTEKIRRLMERAETLSAKAEFLRARTELESLLAIDANNTAAKAMLDWVIKEANEQEQLRQVREYLEGARTRLEEMNFLKAGELLAKARELDPLNIEIEALGRMVRVAEEKEGRRKLLVQRIAEIEDSLGKNDLETAGVAAERALGEFPDEPQVIRMHAQVSRRIEVQKKRTYVDEQLQAAREFLRKNEYGAAQAVLEKACQTVPEDPRLATFLKTVLEAQQRAELETARQEAIREAEARIRSHNFAAAIEALEKSLARCGQSAEIMDLLQFARERLGDQQKQERVRAVLSQAQDFLRNDRHEEAIQFLLDAQKEFKSGEIDQQLVTAREEQASFERQREETITRALQLLEIGETSKAVALFEAAPKSFFKNENFQRAYSQFRQSLDRVNFVATTAQQINKCLAGEDLSSAESLLKQALESYPEDPTLRSLAKRLREEVLRRQREQRRKLIEESQVAMGRMEYQRAAKLLTSVSWEGSDLPDLAGQAKAILQEIARREQEYVIVVKAQNYLRDEQYDDAVQVLARAAHELKSAEIDSLLATARERQQGFQRRRDEIIARASQLLESGDAASAVAAFVDAPKIYFKDDNFQRVYLQCRQRLDRDNFVQTAAEQIQQCLAVEDISSAQSLLDQALQAYPDDAGLLALRKRLQEEESRLRREERIKLLEEAQVAIGQMEYARAEQLLKSVEWDAEVLPELADQARQLLEDAQRRQSEQSTPQLVPVVPKRRGSRIPPARPAPETAPANKPWIGRAAMLGIAVIVLAAFGFWYAKGRNPSGYLELTAAPWAQVADVSNAKGEHLNITGQTPLRVALPPGRYVIQLKNGQSSCKVEAVVARGSVSMYGCAFPEVRIDDLVQKILASY
jgi:serine/threonine-protein kinase